MKGKIDIGLYEELIQFAYHRTADLNEKNTVMYIGFYFARQLGCRTPLFQVDDLLIQKEFENHFDSVLKKGDIILSYPPNGQGRQFNEDLFVKCKNHLASEIGQVEVDRLIS